MTLLCAALLAILPAPDVASATCARAEINHVGRPLRLSQLVLWDKEPDGCWHVRDWTYLDGVEIDYDGTGAVIHVQRGHRVHVIRAGWLHETRTTWDVEVADQRRWPIELRRTVFR